MHTIIELSDDRTEKTKNVKNGGYIMTRFEGSEKQIKFANDIIERAKSLLDDEIKDLESDVIKGMKVESTLNNPRILTEITKEVLSNISEVWSASDVIDKRLILNGMSSGPVWEILGIRRRGSKLKIENGGSYSYTDLKNDNTKKEFVKEVLQHLRK